MTTILNITQHSATPEQKAAGVVDLPESSRIELCRLLTFDNLPDKKELDERANSVLLLVKSIRDTYNTDVVMIGGAPFFMPTIYRCLEEHGYTPCFAFSKRTSSERIKEDGTVEKISCFRHEGFVF